MPGRHTEAAFEAAIESYLTASGGYVKGDRDAFDAERCIDRAAFLVFVQGDPAGRVGVSRESPEGQGCADADRRPVPRP